MLEWSNNNWLHIDSQIVQHQRKAKNNLLSDFRLHKKQYEDEHCGKQRHENAIPTVLVQLRVNEKAVTATLTIREADRVGHVQPL